MSGKGQVNQVEGRFVVADRNGPDAHPAAALRQRADLVRHLARRDFLLSYRGSALGIVWAVLIPIAQLVVLVFVFTRVVPLRIESYPAFLFSALLPWTWFSSSLSRASLLFFANRDLVRRPGFAPELLLVANALSNLLTFFAALPALFALLLWYDRPPSAALLALPLLLLVQGVLIVGLGLVAATLNVFYRDIQHMIHVGLMLLFYLTPVFYDVDATLPGAELLYYVNPMAGLVDGYRSIFFSGDLPAASRTAAAGLLSLGCAALGVWLHRRRQHDLVDIL